MLSPDINSKGLCPSKEIACGSKELPVLTQFSVARLEDVDDSRSTTVTLITRRGVMAEELLCI